MEQVGSKDLNTSDGQWGRLVLKISTLVMDSGWVDSKDLNTSHGQLGGLI